MAEPQSQQDVAFGEHPKQKLDIYWESSFRNAPIVVNIHGGGWMNGDKSGFGSRQYQDLVINELGCVLVSPNYRLIGDFTEGGDDRAARARMSGKVDAMISDVASAVAYVQKNAKEYGADPSRVIVMGSSAGGHLSAVLAYCNSRDWLEGTPYAGEKLNIVGWYGDSAPLSKDFNAQIPFNDDGIPMLEVDKDDPPGLMIVGSRDRLVPQDNSLKFQEKLKELGIWGQVIISENGPHVVGKGIVSRDDMRKPFIDFVNFAIGETKAPATDDVIRVK